VREVDVPAAPGAIGPSLAAAADGRALLSWVEPRAGGRHALRLARRVAGSGWAGLVTVAEGAGWFVNWADFPHAAALDDGTLFAHWMEKRPGGEPYDYDIRLTRSRDGGRTWDRPLSPHADRTPAEHGFVSFAPIDEARLGVLFLDGREAKAGGATSLRFAVVGPSGPPEPDERVDARVCDCCQTALARTARGMVAAYRDRSPAEVRDIAVVRREGGRWSAPVFPGSEGWEIHGCPVNGPSLAADGDRVALAWFTMAGETPRVKVAFSSDGGAIWGRPVVVDEGRPIGRVDVALLAPGAAAGRGAPAAALVSWMEDADEGAEVRVRRAGADGSRGPSTLVARSSAARTSGFPRLVRAGVETLVVWRDASEPPRLRVAALEVGE
jgi:hypothetical protein